MTEKRLNQHHRNTKDHKRLLEENYIPIDLKI